MQNRGAAELGAFGVDFMGPSAPTLEFSCTYEMSRYATFSALLRRHVKLFSRTIFARVLVTESDETMSTGLDTRGAAYWSKHLSYGNKNAKRSWALGEQFEA